MLDYQYLIVLFKNRVRKKIIKSFKTSKRCVEFYNKLLSENKNVVFYRTHENGYECDYEIAILEKTEGNLFPIYTTDEYGRNVKVELEENDFNVIKISKYKIPEKIFDLKKNKRIEIKDFIKLYLDKPGVKLISKLNNRIVVQRDDKYDLFSLKTPDDAMNFIDNMTSHFLYIGRKDCIFVKDISTAQRKYLYEILENAGYSRSFLYRQVTTFGVKK